MPDEAEAFTASVDSENVLLIIEAADVESENSMLLTDNLTTESVTAIISFASEEPGEVSLPEWGDYQDRHRAHRLPELYQPVRLRCRAASWRPTWSSGRAMWIKSSAGPPA